MRVVWGLLLTCLVVSAAMAASSGGKLDYDGVQWSVKDGLALSDADGVLVVLAPFRFDRKALAKDGVIDRVAVIEGNPSDSTMLLLDFDAEGILRYVRHQHAGSETSTESAEMLSAFELHAFDETRIAGTLSYAGEGESIDVDFSLPIDATPGG